MKDIVSPHHGQGTNNNYGEYQGIGKKPVC